MPSQLLTTFPLIALSIAMGVGGQTVIKIGVSDPTATAIVGGPAALVAFILRSPLVLLGLAMYGVGALSWVAVLSRLDLGYAYPFLALNFVLITLISWLILGEHVPGLRWVGLAFICVGIVLVAQSAAGR